MINLLWYPFFNKIMQWSVYTALLYYELFTLHVFLSKIMCILLCSLWVPGTCFACFLKAFSAFVFWGQSTSCLLGAAECVKMHSKCRKICLWCAVQFICMEGPSADNCTRMFKKKKKKRQENAELRTIPLKIVVQNCMQESVNGYFWYFLCPNHC